MGGNHEAETRDLAVVLPTDRDRTQLSETPPAYRIHWLDDDDFEYPQPGADFDMVAYTERASRYVEENDIDGLVYTHDIANLVAGAIHDRHDLPGPGLESMFLTDHKYYSRKNQPAVPWFDYIDVETGEWGEMDPRFPAYVKPPFLTMTLLQYKVDSREEYDEALSVIQSELPKYTAPFNDFFAEYVDANEYPLATEDIVLVEESLEDWTQHCIEGWVDPDGEIHIWAISDHNYYQDGSFAIDNYATPSTLPEDEQRELMDIATDAIENHAVEHGFWNVEIFGLEDRKVITEVNGRTASVWEPLYDGTFDTSVYEGVLHLSADRPEATEAVAPDWSPDPEYDRIGGQFHVVTYGEGPAEEYLDFEYARSVPDTDVQIFVEPGEEITQTRTSGFWLARFHLFGDDYDHILERADEIRANMLFQPEKSPEPERYT